MCVRPCVCVLSCVSACVRSWASPLVSLQPPRLSLAHNFAGLGQSKTNRLAGYSAGSKREYLYYFCHRDSSTDTQTDTMREILHLQTGQCGNQIGSKVRTSASFFFFEKAEKKKEKCFVICMAKIKHEVYVTTVWILCYGGRVTFCYIVSNQVNTDFIEIGSKALC